jgi:FAD/FMN-containing dehydrogenase
MTNVSSRLAGVTALATLGAAAVAWGVSRRRRARRRTVCDDPALHARKLERICRQLRDRQGDGPVSLRKRAVSHQVPKARDRRRHDDKVDITDLNAILEIDPDRRICVAEPGVTFVDLVAATMRHGLVPIVVPELKTITVGGAVSGCSIESTSFRHGGFHDTCLEYEVVTGRGEVVTCTPDGPDALLFQMMHGAFGTLGILSKLTFRLMPAKPFVKVSYERFGTLDELLQAIARHARDRDLDFMDGFAHSPTEYVLNVGRFVDTAPYTHRYDWVKVYYQSTRTRTEDYLETPDYFFRYDHGVTSVHPRSRLARLFLGKLLGSAQVLRLAERLRGLVLDDDRPTVTLDVFLPMSRVPAFLGWYEREFQFYPLWVVPYRRVRDYEWIDASFYAGLEDDLFLDLAIYGMEQRGDRNYYRLMEEELRALGGIKTLIAHNYYSEEEFWSIWNKANYDQIKARTDPDNRFRDLYAKTCRAAMGRE